VSDPIVYFAIRDDDTCFFTQPEQLESCYSAIWETCPVSLSVVPFHACTKSGAVPREHWTGDAVFPLERNEALVAFLRRHIAAGRVHATLHGYHHRDEPNGYEFAAGADLDRKVREGRQHVETVLDQPVTVFVPPHNALGRAGYRAVTDAGLDISGIPSFHPRTRGWDPRVFAIALRERAWFRQYGFRRPWPIQFPDGHHETPYHPLTPRVSLADLQTAFDRVGRIGGVFCLATHYSEFDAAQRDGSGTLRDVLARFWDHVLQYRSQLRFVNLGALSRVAPPAVTAEA